MKTVADAWDSTLQIHKKETFLEGNSFLCEGSLMRKKDNFKIKFKY